MDETIEMYRLMKDAPGMFMVGFNRPYSPLMQSAKRAYERLRADSVTIVYRIVGEGKL